MKILYISLGEPDYQCDCLLHGFYKLLGSDLTHSDDYFLMYKDYVDYEILNKTSGRGFTIWGNLPKYLNDKTDLVNKIKNKYFDYIIYGSFRRNSDYIDLVLSVYPKSRIAIVDGEDDNKIQNPHGLLLFKRELIYNHPNLMPISFSIPSEKIVKNEKEVDKIKLLSDYKPNNPGTGYVYNNESDYYHNYKEAFFGLTHKKSGWDCMRHYEILANYCLPYFPDLKYCPESTMNNFPKNDILKGNSLFENGDTNENYYEILERVFEYTKNNLTTETSSKYVLDTLIGLNT